MSKKGIRRVSAGITMYYGIGSLVVAALGLVAVVVWLYKVFTGEKDFSWGDLMFLLMMTGIMAGLGYALVRVGSEESEE